MNEEKNNTESEEIIEKIKELVKKGNIARILVKHDEHVFLNIPLNAGIAGTVLGLAAAPWALVASAIATLGLDCKIELIKTDGGTIELLSRDAGKKYVDVGSAIVNDVKDRFKKD